MELCLTHDTTASSHCFPVHGASNKPRRFGQGLLVHTSARNGRDHRDAQVLRHTGGIDHLAVGRSGSLVRRGCFLCTSDADSEFCREPPECSSSNRVRTLTSATSDVILSKSESTRVRLATAYCATSLHLFQAENLQDGVKHRLLHLIHGGHCT